MQRKQIKIDGEYGVLARVTTKNQHAKVHAPATVIALTGGVYNSWTGYSDRKRDDGIIVTFAEPMVHAYDEFKPVASYGPDFKPDRREIIKPGHPVVIESAKQVVGEWQPIAEMKARWAEENLEAARRVDAEADITEPIVREIDAALKRHGISKAVKTIEYRGTTARRVTDGYVTLDIEEIAKLLGVSVAAS